RIVLLPLHFSSQYLGDHPDLHSIPTRRSSDLLVCDIMRAASGAPGIEHFERSEFADTIALLKQQTNYVSGFLPTLSEGVALAGRSEEHTSELQSQSNLVCRLLLEKKKNIINIK